MKKLVLYRLENTYSHTIGVLVDVDADFMLGCTMENPWLDNERNISCIPEGTYKAVRHISPKYGGCFKVLDVPNRSDILIHPGNYERDTKGCILLGSGVGVGDRGLRMVTNSRVAVDQFLEHMGDGCLLEIRREV
jgi:hypothetical protein